MSHFHLPPAWILLVASALVTTIGCSPSTTEHEADHPTSPTVATYRGGQVSLEALEDRLRQNAAFERSPVGEMPMRDRDAWLNTIERATRDLAFEHLMVPEYNVAALPELAEVSESIRREAIVDLYLAQQAAPSKPSSDEISDYFDEHPDAFEQAGRRFVWNLFRRQRAGESKADTIAFLNGLAKRVEGGETFRSLAAQYSDSETRLLDGRLGWIDRGRLPKGLEDTLFALKTGELSEPIPVSGGAALFQVSDAFFEKSYSLDDARLFIAARLGREALSQQLEDLVVDVALPENAVVLDDEALETALRESAPEEVILELEDWRYSVSELLTAASEETTLELTLVEPLDRVRELYRERKNRYLLSLRALEEGFPATATLQERLESQIDDTFRQQIIDLRSRQRMEARVDRAPELLSEFHRDNDHLFQSALRLEIVTLTVDLGADAAASMATLESLRGRLVAGDLTLEEAASEAGGKVSEPQWLDQAALGALEPKVRLYLLELGGPGYAIPFQLNKQLNLIWVRARDEPRILSLEEAGDTVRQAYLDRHQQDLFQEVMSEVLAENDFTYRADEVATLLGVPAAPP